MNQRLNRRTALKGLGGVVIGLPLLEEMMIRPARATATTAPRGSRSRVQRVLRTRHSRPSANGRI